MTVWADSAEVKTALESAVFDQHDIPGWVRCWTEHDATGRLQARYEAIPGFDVLDYRDGFCGVRLKGTACEAFGEAAMQSVLNAFPEQRSRAIHIDVAWDGFGLKPSTVRRLIKNGHVRTRAKLDPWFHGSEDGDTLYSHKKPNKRDIARWFRIYTQRGPTRFEQVFKKKFAQALGEKLAIGDTSEWNNICLGALRSFIDLLDPSHGYRKDKNLDKAPLHKVWKRLVGEAKKWKPDAETRTQRKAYAEEILLRYEQKWMNSAVWIRELIEAVGENRFLDSVYAQSEGKIDAAKIECIKSAVSERAEKASWKKPGRGDEIPF